LQTLLASDWQEYGSSRRDEGLKKGGLYPMIVSMDELKKAADKGPIYLMLLAGAGLVAGVVPAEFTVGQLHALTPVEFITANVVGAVLIITAGVISLLASRSMLRTLEGVSKASTATAGKALDTIQTTAAKISETDAITQNKVLDRVGEITKQLGLSSEGNVAEG
jgi:hypothetical protein